MIKRCNYKQFTDCGEWFDPYGLTNRAMIATVLWRMEGDPEATKPATFKDNLPGQWYTEAVSWAAANVIVKGYNANEFGPMDTLTREQLAAILFRYAQFKGYDVSVGENTNILSYADAESVTGYAVSAMQWAVGAGVINGVGTNGTVTLDPQGDAPRAQIATILYRFDENVAK